MNLNLNTHPITKTNPDRKFVLGLSAETFDYETALKKMKQGAAVGRKGWRETVAMALLDFESPEVHVTSIALGHDGKLVLGFTPTIHDQLARDWFLYEG